MSVSAHHYQHYTITITIGHHCWLLLPPNQPINLRTTHSHYHTAHITFSTRDTHRETNSTSSSTLLHSTTLPHQHHAVHHLLSIIRSAKLTTLRALLLTVH